VGNSASYYSRKWQESRAENSRLRTEHRDLQETLTWCHSRLLMALNDEPFSDCPHLCAHIEKLGCASDRRVSTENGRAEKVDSPVIADDRQYACRACGLPMLDGEQGAWHEECIGYAADERQT